MRRLWQVHVQSSQQKIDVMDPEIHTQRNGPKTLDTYLTTAQDFYHHKLTKII